MGLDDVEIYMDLEFKFQIPFNPDDQFNGQIGYIVNYYTSRFNVQYFQDLLERVSDYYFVDENNISRDDYNKFARQMGWPQVPWFNPNKNPRSKQRIIENLKETIDALDFQTPVSETVKLIISERLCINYEILDTHNIYKDLGAG